MNFFFFFGISSVIFVLRKVVCRSPQQLTNFLVGPSWDKCQLKSVASLTSYFPPVLLSSNDLLLQKRAHLRDYRYECAIIELARLTLRCFLCEPPLPGSTILGGFNALRAACVRGRDSKEPFRWRAGEWCRDFFILIMTLYTFSTSSTQR
jgi:hypothetical protein